MYVKADHILYSDIEGRECIINFGNISLASLPPVIEPTVVLSVGQNSGFIATQEETQILLDLKADLVGGLVPSAQLPPAVDEILEYTDSSFFPVTGVSNKYYLDLTTNKTYRWSGSVYVPINEGIALGETSSTAYRGDRGKIAYDHSLVTTGNPHNVTKSDVGLSAVDNTSDADKPISTAVSTAITPATAVLFNGNGISLENRNGTDYLQYTQVAPIVFALIGTPVLLGFAMIEIVANGNAITPIATWKNVGSDNISIVNGAINRFIITQVSGNVWYTVKVS